MITADATAIVGTVVTAGALVYTMLKDLTTRKEVKDLKVLAEELVNANKLASDANSHFAEQNFLQKKQMAISVRPLFREFYYVPEAARKFRFELKNTGQTALNIEVKNFESKNATLDNKYPYAVFNGEALILTGNTKVAQNASFKFLLSFRDMYGNHYEQTHTFNINELFSTSMKITYS